MCLTTTAAGASNSRTASSAASDVDEVVEAELLAARAEALGARERSRRRVALDVERARSGAGSRRSEAPYARSKGKREVLRVRFASSPSGRPHAPTGTPLIAAS